MEAKVSESKQTIVVKDFYGPGEDIKESDLGWQKEQKQEARSLVSKEIFKYEVITVGLNMVFYYVDNDTFYAIHREVAPIEVKELPRDRTEKYIGFQCKADSHEEGKVLYTFDDPNDIWNGVKIDGRSLEDVIDRSYIIVLN